MISYTHVTHTCIHAYIPHMQEFITVLHKETTKTYDAAELADSVWSLFDPKETGFITPEAVQQVYSNMCLCYLTAITQTQ